MTTSIDFLDDEMSEIDNVPFSFEDYDSLTEVIMSFDLNENVRIEGMERLYLEDPDQAVETLYRLLSILELSGIKTLEGYLERLCLESNIDVILKLHIAKSLNEHEDLLYASDSEDDEIEMERKKNFNAEKRLGNKNRKIKAGKILSYILSDCKAMAAPSRVEAIKSLAKINHHFDEAIEYFIDFVNDADIDCGFRYKTLVSIENMDRDYFIDFLLKILQIKS